jgi:hypothetical protein
MSLKYTKYENTKIIVNIDIGLGGSKNALLAISDSFAVGQNKNSGTKMKYYQRILKNDCSS